MKFKNNLFANVALVSLGLIFGAGLLFAVNADTTQTYYQDIDGDGYGDSDISISTTTQPAGYVLNDGDCDETSTSTNPGADEVCDGVDNNCNGDFDEGVTTTFYYDGDGDNYGLTASSTETCEAPAGYVENFGDCNDIASSSNPDALEVCDGADNNCDGEVDEGVTTTYFMDNDGDGYGLTASTTQACALPVGHAVLNNDCDDTSIYVFPGADELLNLVDDDCDGLVDEGFSMHTFYIDEDQDGYGSNASTSLAYEAPEGFVDNNNDCDDSNSSVHPNAVELCDGVDNNCSDGIDEGVKTEFYFDGDNDGYGVDTDTRDACEADEDYVEDDGDCDDDNNTIYPGATELVDNLDNDCDGDVDESEVTYTFYRDQDGDDYGDEDESVEASEAPNGYVDNNNDCDDNNDTVYPGAEELDDNIDNDCDGRIDEGLNNNDDDCDCDCDCDRGDDDDDDDDDCYGKKHGHADYKDGDYKNRGQYVSFMAHLTNSLKKSGIISGKEKGSIMSSLKGNKKGKKGKKK